MDLNPITALTKFREGAVHVLSVSYKPNMSQFQKTLKIVLVGTLIVGVLGYLISIIIKLLIGF